MGGKFSFTGLYVEPLGGPLGRYGSCIAMATFVRGILFNDV